MEWKVVENLGDVERGDLCRLMNPTGTMFVADKDQDGDMVFFGRGAYRRNEVQRLGSPVGSRRQPREVSPPCPDAADGPAAAAVRRVVREELSKFFG